MIHEPPAKRVRVVYMIHYERNDGAIRHYAGQTWEDRLNVRLKEHRRGVTTPSTKKAREDGFTAKVYHMAPMVHPIIEQVLRIEHVAIQACPTCSPPGDLMFIQTRVGNGRFQPLVHRSKRSTRKERRDAYEAAERAR